MLSVENNDKTNYRILIWNKSAENYLASSFTIVQVGKGAKMAAKIPPTDDRNTSFQAIVGLLKF